VHDGLYAHEILYGDVAQDAVALTALPPGRDQVLADSAAVRQHIPAGATGVEATTGRRVQGARDIYGKADFLIILRHLIIAIAAKFPIHRIPFLKSPVID
jgi:hypothetical protein